MEDGSDAPRAVLGLVRCGEHGEAAQGVLDVPRRLELEALVRMPVRVRVVHRSCGMDGTGRRKRRKGCQEWKVTPLQGYTV